MTKYIYSLLFFASIVSIASGQINKNTCQDLRLRFNTSDTVTSGGNAWHHIVVKEGKPELNYVTPLRRNFFNQIPYSFDNGSWQYIAELLSFAGDHKGSINIIREHNIYESENGPASKPEISFDKSSLVNFTTLLDAIDTCKVVMINEDHNRVQPRAFLLSVLSQLKSRGFTHLAIETLNHVGQNDVSINTGYFTAEPMFGEVARGALRLGFTLVPYEDTCAVKHTNAQRETAQAVNIFNAIKAAPRDAKFLVVAGYAHIAEDFPSDILSTMAMQFKAVSGMDPFTIDQLTFLEEYGYLNYITLNQWSKGLKESKAILNTSHAISVGLAHYDAFIIHPVTRLIHCRPDWLSCLGLKKEIKIKCTNKKVILIQAYYQNEIRSQDDFKTRIPADQSFYLDNNAICRLYLVPRYAYVIVFRDENNNIIDQRLIAA